MGRLLVAGCRDYTNYELVENFISESIVSEDVTIVSGGAKGVDSLAKQYALSNNIPYEEYAADWNKYGKSAGPIRNLQMAEICDDAIIFWDRKSRGTKDMIEKLKQLGKYYIVVYI